MNLVLNAIDAAPTQSTVTVRTYTQDGHIHVDTQNGGMPIPQAELALIFEPFFTTKPKGTGLGLSIARNIARAHGGDLVLATNDQDRIRFSLSLPSPNGQPKIHRN
jgi:signal transduction histidine kinase